MIDPVSLKIHAATSLETPFTDGDIEEMRRQLPPSDVTANTATKIARNTVLKRLTLVLLNKCNLACSYCYEDEGTFGIETKLTMDLETAKKTIRLMYETYESIENLMFFGGEPFLRHQIMPEVAAFTVDYCKEQGRPLPQFGVITNGTITNDRILQFIKDYNVSVTVSLDGDEETHDLHRFDKLKKGSHKKAVEGLEKFREVSDSVHIQATVSPDHVKDENHVTNTIDYFSKSLGVQSPHITPAGEMNKNHKNSALVGAFIRAAQKYIQNLEDGVEDHSYTLGSGILRRLIFGSNSEYTCPAGFELAVDPNGEIYPCFMFVGRPEKVLGNVENFHSDTYWKSWENFMKVSLKRERLGCKSCWARNLCSGCMGANENVTGDLKYNPEFHCEIVQGTSEVIVGSLSEIQQSPDRWRRFVANVKSSSSQGNTADC